MILVPVAVVTAAGHVRGPKVLSESLLISVDWSHRQALCIVMSTEAPKLGNGSLKPESRNGSDLLTIVLMDYLLSSSNVVPVTKDNMALPWLSTPQSQQAEVRRALLSHSLKPDPEHMVAIQHKALDVQIVLPAQC